MTTTNDVLYPANGECVAYSAYTAAINRLVAAASTYSEPVEIAEMYARDNYAHVTLDFDGFELTVQLPVTLDRRVLCGALVRAFRNEAREVRDGMDAQALVDRCWASLTAGREDTGDVDATAHIIADVTARVLHSLKEDADYYGALLCAAERLAAAVI